MQKTLFPTSVIGSLPRPQFVRELIADDCPFSDDEYERLMGAPSPPPVHFKETPGSMSLPTVNGGAKATSASLPNWLTASNSAKTRPMVGLGPSSSIGFRRSSQGLSPKR